jgi:beta-glucosidase
LGAEEARVENNGSRTIEEFVQLYIHDQVSSMTRLVRELKAFKKVALRAGKAKIVTFTIRRKDLEFVGRDLQRVAEPGLFQAWIAPSCLAGNPVAFILA